jgi:hypothetical protein
LGASGVVKAVALAVTARKKKRKRETREDMVVVGAK